MANPEEYEPEGKAKYFRVKPAQNLTPGFEKTQVS